MVFIAGCDFFGTTTLTTTSSATTKQFRPRSIRQPQRPRRWIRQQPRPQ
ncbi:MAG: hypothetical protein MZU79_02600 [Anaerotruncus sp.]|nr:hypothetical protein [Anaerotruncus sp.]